LTKPKYWVIIIYNMSIISVTPKTGFNPKHISDIGANLTTDFMSKSPEHFADRVIEQIKLKQSFLVLGIDPNFDLLPEDMRPRYLEKYEINGKLWDFVKSLIDNTADLVCAVKFQSAYFEQFGSWGVRVLAKSVQYAKSVGLLVIMDAKRGDIGSTSEAYAKAYLNSQKTFKNFEFYSYLDSDAVTVNPFLGLDTLDNWLDVAKQGKGVFVLVKTSNPGSGFIQDAMIGDKTVSQSLANFINSKAEESLGESGYSNLGAVVGATKIEESLDLRSKMPKSIILAPGIGAQGGSPDDIRKILDENGLGVIVPVSRGISFPTGVNNYKEWVIAVRKNAEELKKILEF
jgi:orotidine-5'-phosphate decarboxylase